MSWNCNGCFQGVSDDKDTCPSCGKKKLASQEQGETRTGGKAKGTGRVAWRGEGGIPQGGLNPNDPEHQAAAQEANRRAQEEQAELERRKAEQDAEAARNQQGNQQGNQGNQ